MSHKSIYTNRAPQPIGAYSQAIQAGNTVYLSGQVPLHPETMTLVSGDFRDQVRRVLDNLQAVAQAAGGSLIDTVKLTIYLTDLANFPIVNEVMAEYFQPPYPARATVGVIALPRDAAIEMDAILELG